LNVAEEAWWQRYAEVEDRYCWVQSHAIQRFLRGRYLQRVLAGIPRGARVLEIGCGSGWLCLLLAHFGAAHVHGLDPSAAQIERARAAAATAPHGAQIEFHLGTMPDVGSGAERSRYEALVLHGVLHHLSRKEISELLETFTLELAQPGARVFILEPVRYRTPSTRRSALDRLIDALILLPRVGRKLGFRRVGAHEASLTEWIDSRGDSPKEAPFLPGELEALLEPHLRVEHTEPVLSFSYLGAKNALLMQLSHPGRGRLLQWPYLWMLRAMERVVLRLRRDAVWLPLFVLFECQVRDRGVVE
jgi:2-polyprenyl-3-methyl-5-hydroxy-6-metoxy-1,4-benzoquinol methylase